MHRLWKYLFYIQKFVKIIANKFVFDDNIKNKNKFEIEFTHVIFIEINFIFMRYNIENQINLENQKIRSLKNKFLILIWRHFSLQNAKYFKISSKIADYSLYWKLSTEYMHAPMIEDNKSEN